MQQFVSLEGGERIELTQHARAAGRENLPAPWATEPNEVEAAIWREHEGRHTELVEQTRNELRECAAAFEASSNQLASTTDLGTAVGDAAADLERELAADRSIPALVANRDLSRRDLRMFVREHHLNREPRYPESPWLTVGIAALLVVAESWANSGFFAGSSFLGILGGFLQAVAISVVNVISGFAAGFFGLRWFHHRRLVPRTAGGTGLALLAVFALSFNAAVSHYRDLANIGSVTGTELVSGLLRHPLDLTLPSLALFATGLLAWGLALWKGFRLDDAYPGYGDIHRRFRLSEKALVTTLDALRARILDRIVRIPQGCWAIVKRDGEVLGELDEIVLRAHRAFEMYETTREHLKDRCELFLRRYRDENRAVRTAPEPPHFSVYPEFSPRVQAREVAYLQDRARVAREEHGALQATAQRIHFTNAGRIREAALRFDQHVLEQMGRAEPRDPDASGAAFNQFLGNRGRDD